MKYVILIHSNPEPWGHPTDRFTAEGKAMPESYHADAEASFEKLMNEISASGELVIGEALGDPTTSTLMRWSPESVTVTEGPYAETKEHLAGFFLIDCATRERAEEIAATFAQPGGTIELRPAMWPGGDDQ